MGAEPFVVPSSFPYEPGMIPGLMGKRFISTGSDVIRNGGVYLWENKAAYDAFVASDLYQAAVVQGLADISANMEVMHGEVLDNGMQYFCPGNELSTPGCALAESMFIVFLTFSTPMSPVDFEGTMDGDAGWGPYFAPDVVPGLDSKRSIMVNSDMEMTSGMDGMYTMGGLYFFQDRASFEAWVASDHYAGTVTNGLMMIPGVADTAQWYELDVVPELAELSLPDIYN